ncbi:TPA: hypothetical protein ACGOTK_000574 [Streptococcus suis]
MANQFKNLNLDRDVIIEFIKKFFTLKSELTAQVNENFEEINSSTGQNRCEIVTNQGEMFLDVYFKKDGRSTLMSTGGDQKFLEIKRELCDFIAENCKSNEIQKNVQLPWFTADNIRKEDVGGVVESIKASNFFKKEISYTDGNGYPIWQFKGDQNENLTITYYNKDGNGFGKLVLQGRPELLFLESIEIITQLFDTDEISTKLNESGFFESTIDDSIIQNDILSIMPNSFDKLPSDNLRKTIKQALIFKNFKSNWADFTVYTFPAYRALEGHYRYILNETNITYSGTTIRIWKDSIDEGNYPRKLIDSNDDVVVQKYGARSDEFKKYLTDVNQIISKERNKYFHWEKFEPSIFLDETALVEDEETARAIIVNCLTQIEKYYTIFNQS